MKTIALTGATGFVGRITLGRLVEAGWQVRALTRRDQANRHDVTWINGALDDPESLKDLCTGADAVLHIAGVVNAYDAAGFESGNVTGTANLLAAATEAGISRFVHVSSLAAKQPHLSLYGASKQRGETLVQKTELDWTIIRPPGVYGPGDTEMLDMFRLAAKGWALLPPPGRISVIHVDDLARLLVALVPSQPGVSSRIFEADDGAGNGWSHESFARAIGSATGRKVRVFHAPRFLLKVAASGDRLFRGRKAKLTQDRASYLSHPDWTVNPEAKPPSGLWVAKIVTLQGLKETTDWYKAQGWL